MSAESYINLSSYFNSSTLNSRDEADLLLSKIKQFHSPQKIVLDFSGIDFVSRSFIDQYQKREKELAKERKFNIQIVGAIVLITAMLFAVSHFENTKQSPIKRLPVTSFKDLTSLIDYLKTIQ